MNIFILDKNPITAAEMSCDRHVVKMILESAQLLSTAHHVLYGSPTIASGKKKKYNTYSNGNTKICKCTMINHPCSIWTRETRENYIWLLNHAKGLCKEYTFRYNKVHAMEEMINLELAQIPFKITIGSITPFAQAMPDQYKNSCPVIAYRQYYLGEKTRFATWKNRKEPDWYATKNPMYELNMASLA